VTGFDTRPNRTGDRSGSFEVRLELDLEDRVMIKRDARVEQRERVKRGILEHNGGSMRTLGSSTNVAQVDYSTRSRLPPEA
jgi:uncharacterized protein with PIN domain